VGNKSKALGLAAAATLSCAATQADAAACQQTNLFTDYFSGGSNANCSIGNVTILGNSWNPVAENSGLETVSFFTVPPNEPGIEFFVNTILGAANGAVFTFTLSAPANSRLSSLTFTSDIFDGPTSATFSIDANGQFGSVTGGGTTVLTVSPTTSLEITTTITDVLAGANGGPFDNSVANITYSVSETPVPEPSSLMLVGVGLSALGLAATRGRKRAAS
jgi:hypothetical protein